MTSHRSVVLAALAVLAIAGAGCGDDDDDTLSRDEAGARISAICQRVETVGQDLNGDPANDAPILGRFAAALQTAADDMRDLDVPDDMEADRDALAKNADANAAVAKEVRAIAETGDRKAYVAKVEDEVTPLEAESDRLATKLGATGCAPQG